jgi:hypothetical protein
MYKTVPDKFFIKFNKEAQDYFKTEYQSDIFTIEYIISNTYLY